MILAGTPCQLHGTGMLARVQLDRQRSRGLSRNVTDVRKRRKSMTGFAPCVEIKICGKPTGDGFPGLRVVRPAHVQEQAQEQDQSQRVQDLLNDMAIKSGMLRG